MYFTKKVNYFLTLVHSAEEIWIIQCVYLLIISKYHAKFYNNVSGTLRWALPVASAVRKFNWINIALKICTMRKDIQLIKMKKKIQFTFF